MKSLKQGIHFIKFGEKKVDLKKMTITFKKNIEKINQSEKALARNNDNVFRKSFSKRRYI